MKAKKKKKGFYSQHFKLPRIFCQHVWEIEDKIELESAIKEQRQLTTVDGNLPDIFFSRIIFVLRCSKCRMITIEKM